MNTATMRRIDHSLGGTMCAVLTLIRRLTDPVRSRPPERPRQILVVKLAEQGAWVVAWSALQDAIDMVGKENVVVMTFRDNRFVLDQMGLLPPENIWDVRTDGPVRTAIDLLRALRRAYPEIYASDTKFVIDPSAYDAGARLGSVRRSILSALRRAGSRCRRATLTPPWRH